MDMIELRTAHITDLDADANAAVRRLPHGGRCAPGTSRASRSARTGAAGDTAR